MEYDDLKTYCDNCSEMKFNNDVKEVMNGVFWCTNCTDDYLSMME